MWFKHTRGGPRYSSVRLGLAVAEIVIGIGGDESKGASTIQHSQHLPIVDQIDICLAGLEAQSLFCCVTHELVGMSDFAKVIELCEAAGKFDDESERLREAGGLRARSLLMQCKSNVEQLVNALILNGALKIFAVTKMRVFIFRLAECMVA